MMNKHFLKAKPAVSMEGRGGKESVNQYYFPNTKNRSNIFEA
jgi:hypothetical protein